MVTPFAGRIVLFLALITGLAGCGGDSTPTPRSSNAGLAGLSLSAGPLKPGFRSGRTDYRATTGFLAAATTVTATPKDPGATVQINGTTVPSGTASAFLQLAEGVTVITVLVTAADGAAQQAYTVVVARQSAASFAQQAYSKASNSAAFDEYGYSVALSGDTLAVGAIGESSSATGVNGVQGDNSAQDSGAVYVFTRSNGVWAQQAYLKASNTGIDDEFGSSLALSGDTLAVGAWHESSNATGVNPPGQGDNIALWSGAVYVFTRSGGVWTQQAYLKASNAGPNDLFGHSLALSGDTLAVGAQFEDSSATGVNGTQIDNNARLSGAVYVFTRSNGVWTQQAYLKAFNTESNERLGYSLALSGDTLAAGAIFEDSGATGVNGDGTDNSAPASGAVYVFTRTGTVWSQQAYVKASNTGAGDQFGWSVALSGDTLTVGAIRESSGATGVNGDGTDNSASDSGAVYVFTRSHGTWTQQAYLKASNTGAGDLFGQSVALAGDTLAVGAPGEESGTTGVNGDGADNSALASGAVYLFTRMGTVWTQQAYLKASNSERGDWFGHAVALSGDTLVAGATGESGKSNGVNGDMTDNSAMNSGAAYVFR